MSLRKEDRWVCGDGNKKGGFSLEVAVFYFFRANRGDLMLLKVRRGNYRESRKTGRFMLTSVDAHGFYG